MMNRVQKVDFIRRNFPDVYPVLKKEVPNILEDPLNITPKDVEEYNKCLTDTLRRQGHGTALLNALKF